MNRPLPHVALLALLLACHRRGGEASVPPSGTPAVPVAAPATGAPRITALEPDSLRFGPNTLQTLTIRGIGFAPASAGGQLVQVGPIALTAVPANASGTAITVTVPERYAPPGGGAPRPLMPGAYDVRVTVGSLTSNSATLRVLP